ncbi:hypothetical protein ABZP36_001186 [Zizania latifolia]
MSESETATSRLSTRSRWSPTSALSITIERGQAGDAPAEVRSWLHLYGHLDCGDFQEAGGAWTMQACSPPLAVAFWQQVSSAWAMQACSSPLSVALWQQVSSARHMLDEIRIPI